LELRHSKTTRPTRTPAIGFRALVKSTNGESNTAGGWRALFQNTTGDRNTASGREALLNNTTGFENTGTGGVALQNNRTGNDNTATGFAALNSNTSGASNTADGTGALVNSTGDLNIALGFGAGVNLFAGNNNIGNVGVSTESNVIRSALRLRSEISLALHIPLIRRPTSLESAAQLFQVRRWSHALADSSA
jgi:hypothetical protein